MTSDLYRERDRIEDLLARRKTFRRSATLYEQLHTTFASMSAIAYILVALKA